MPDFAPPARLASALADRYRLESELGAGGMATVYLAHDLRHDRKVAVKVLKPELAAVIGAERFLKEIRTTANLQHPHILALHDSGTADSYLYYVMPYVQGESLRDRLSREKQLPVADAVRIATTVASALDYAHRHGVIHRDIKPENILLNDGEALVADFGIALAATNAGGSRMTETGMSIGTPTYMSPEQAIGERDITERSDVYALGCITYEMLTGDPPFTGSSAQAIISRVMTEEPRRVVPQRKNVPAALEAAVLTALEKLPADRFATAAEFAAAVSTGARTGVTPLPATAAVAPLARVNPRSSMVLVAALLVTVASLAFAAWAWRRSAVAPLAVGRNIVSLGDSTTPLTTVPSLAVSPDGSMLVYREAAPNRGLWIKRRDRLQPFPLPGTERAANPAFSPDGQWIAFIADGRLKKVSAAGGPVVTVADSAASGYGGAAWLDDGTLVFASPQIDALRRVSAAGGAVTTALKDTLLAGLGLGMPMPLPQSRGVLFQGCTSGCVTMGIYVLDLRSGRQKLLLSDVATALYAGNDRILYVRRDGTALVTGFNLDRLELVGQPAPVVDGVQVGNGYALLAASTSGTIVYLRGSGNNAQNVAVRVTPSGAATPVDTGWYGPSNGVALSPDGRRLVLSMGVRAGDLNIWMKQLDRGPVTRLTFGGRDRRPEWSPDGRTIAFLRDTGNTSYVMARAADGSTPDRLLARINAQPQEIVWSSDGNWLVLRTDNTSAGAGDLIGVRVSGDTTAVPVVASPFTELTPALSPDSRWIAYGSNESGDYELYVRPFPNTSASRVQVSVAGGLEPRWSRDARTLFFLNGAKRMIAAHLEPGSEFAVASMEPLFDASQFRLDGFHQSYTVTPDGQFLFLSPRREAGEGPGSTSVVWVENWR